MRQSPSVASTREQGTPSKGLTVVSSGQRRRRKKSLPSFLSYFSSFLLPVNSRNSFSISSPAGCDPGQACLSESLPVASRLGTHRLTRHPRSRVGPVEAQPGVWASSHSLLWPQALRAQAKLWQCLFDPEPLPHVPVITKPRLQWLGPWCLCVYVCVVGGWGKVLNYASAFRENAS